MLRCLTRRTTFADAFRGYTKFCEGKVCSKDVGALILTKISRLARPRRSIAYADFIPTCRITNSFARIWTIGCASDLRSRCVRAGPFCRPCIQLAPAPGCDGLPARCIAALCWFGWPLENLRSQPGVLANH